LLRSLLIMTKAIRRILVPVDCSSCSRAALELALTLGAALGASLDVLFVTSDEAEDALRAAKDELHAFVRGVKNGAAAALEERVLSGDARDRIVTTAAREGFDLIVLGTHGRTGRPRMLAGSVAESVVRTASQPVVTVREPT
jgi:nucleotide-binding universal stress UspA family protein